MDITGALPTLGGVTSAVRAAVEAHVHALNSGDLEAILDTFTDDAVFTSDGGRARGRVELGELFRRVASAHRPLTALRRVDEDGDRCVCTLTRRFAVVDEQGDVIAAHEVDVRAVFTVRDGAVSRVEVDPVV